MSLTNEEFNIIVESTQKLYRFDVANHTKHEYMEGKNPIKTIGIAQPKNMRKVSTHCGWGKVWINAILDGLDFQGWNVAGSEDNAGLDTIYSENNLASEGKLVEYDMLTFGKGFIVLGKGNTTFGEPSVLITAEPPTKMTGNWNPRTRRLDSAISISRDKDQAVNGALYLPNETIWFDFAKVDNKSVPIETYRDVHNLGFVPVVEFINDRESGSTKGHSALTPAILDIIDGVERTQQNLTTNSEFYAAPKRIIYADKDPFIDEDGNVIADAWQSYISAMWLLPNNDDGSQGKVEQLPAASPAPYIDVIKMYGQLFCAETGMPASMLGMNPDGNPASAEALKESRERLTKVRTRKQIDTTPYWKQVGVLALLIANNGNIPVNASDISVEWNDPAPDILAAQADAITKYVAAGVLPADSKVVRSKISIFSDAEHDEIDMEMAKQASQATLTNALAVAASTANAPITNSKPSNA